MANRFEAWQKSWFWWAAVASVVLLQLWWLPGERRQARDSWSPLDQGKLGLYRVLEQLFPEVHRQSDVLVPEQPATLVIVDSVRSPDPRASSELVEFVRSGGHLLFAPGGEEPHWNSSGFPFRLESTEAEREDAENTTNGKRPTDDAGNSGPAPPRTVTVQSLLSDNPVRWKTRFFVRPSRGSNPQVLARDDQQRIHAAAFRFGEGMVVVLSSADVLSNRAMLVPDQAELAVRLVEHAHQFTADSRGVPIIVSEKLNISRVGDTWAILLGPALRSGTLQMFLIGLLVAWAGWYRFGPARKIPVQQRKSMTASAQALGNLQYRTHHGGQVVAAYLDYIGLQARRRSASRDLLDQPELLARRTGLPVPEITRQLSAARELARTGLASRTRAAHSIRWLARLRQKLIRPPAAKSTTVKS